MAEGISGDISERLLKAFTEFEHVADASTAEEAASGLDQATLQLFWQRWPHVGKWAGTLWRLLDEELAEAATPHNDSPHHDVGGSG
jgi:hypothetical protein